jgi:hypothetical protein
VVPVVIAALLLVGVLGATQGWFRGDGSTTANASPSVLASQQTAEPSETTPSPSETDSPSPTPSAKPSSETRSEAGAQALAGCRAKVKADDRTVAAAEKGIGHWSEHVQAQTDANSGKISVDRMDAIFKRTRLAGPDDVQRYRDAVDEADKESGSCSAPAEATSGERKQLNSCAARAEAQQPVLAAAEDGMRDWTSHLAAMRRSRMGHVHDAQGVWIRAWRAAPPHIEAFEKADRAFDAPAC